ncbi:MAG TPA: N-acetyltransferase [Trichocoleus sp.]|jgi:putative acetyltransferase
MNSLTFAAESSADIPQIRAAVTAAFGRSNEADLIDRIRISANFVPELSIVAKYQEVVGHILFSKITIETVTHPVSALALAPLAVTPLQQKQGIGSQLIQVGLAQCHALGQAIVIVLGHPHYYKRFGFEPASRYGIQAPFEVPDEAFMVKALSPDALSQVEGTVNYPAYFLDV